MNRNLKSHLAILGANTIYGLNYVIAKGIMPDFLSPRAIIFLRVSGTVVLFWILRFFLPAEKVEKRDLFRMALCSFFGVGVNQFAFFEGLNRTTPISASIITTAMPIFILIFSHFILKERITRIKDSMPIMKWIFIFGFMIICPFSFTSIASSSFARIPFGIWMSVLFVVFITTGFAYFLINYSLQNVSLNVNGIYIYLQPLVASLFAIILGKDKLTVIDLIASVLIMSGVYLITQ